MSVPDYVFDYYFDKEKFLEKTKGTLLADYKLASISELARELEKSRNLGTSPIQGQFALDGESNNIVQQQYYLLEKVEEQAIYIIQLKEEKDKETAELKARIQALEQAQTQQNSRF